MFILSLSQLLKGDRSKECLSLSGKESLLFLSVIKSLYLQFLMQHCSAHSLSNSFFPFHQDNQKGSSCQTNGKVLYQYSMGLLWIQLQLCLFCRLPIVAEFNATTDCVPSSIIVQPETIEICKLVRSPESPRLGIIRCSKPPDA